ncbi:MAG: UDP-N-acetylmuramoyl-L-alanyl-D-glutamate--2,6-diaminopimelate ligase [Candidatus Moranbacteria bacterium]|nr:UDP-N-acetylmuramoyl-L-alanyl-D-glutamate--2,6-diaminopimelate ligase [Candidatus Moranbacteria bacterium]
MKKFIPQKIKNIYHLLQSVLANFWFGFPTSKLKVIGITGTDGKTTTVQMVARILEEAGKKVAMASTINFRINGEEEKNLSHFTTLSAFAVQKFARRAVDAGCEYLVLETSSHSLDQHRVWGVDYKTAVITNVTREHLDYHQTMEKYRQAKAKLFKKVQVAVVNLDMERPEEYLGCNAGNVFGYSLKIQNPKLQISNKCKIQNQKFKTVIAQNIELGIDKSAFSVGNQKFILNLIGDFNIENALAAISVGVSENIDLATCARALEKITGVPGRMEYVPNEKGLKILVDFALTPIALEKLYSLLVRIKKPQARVIAVFGSCGERDRGKRPIMGEVVSKYADFVIVTDDEPYHENPVQIINEIFYGVIGQRMADEVSNQDPNKKIEGENCWRITGRREAIRKALEIAKSEDIIAVTGMGAEESMIVGDEKIPWNDRQVILEELEKMG